VNQERPARDRIRFRQEKDADIPFIAALYRTTREDELKLVDWSEEQKSQFAQMQFEAQRRHYRENYPGADFLVVTLDHEPIGRLYLYQMQGELRIMDIALMPEHRGRGIGAMLLREIHASAAGRGDFVSIHVEQFNPALHLYHRLGYETAEVVGPYFLMHWRPAPAASVE
jgi:ribosomal protein S18 acetylase RimI-like enzyme